jgi:hypothetical protein
MPLKILSWFLVWWLVRSNYGKTIIKIIDHWQKYLNKSYHVQKQIWLAYNYGFIEILAPLFHPISQLEIKNHFKPLLFSFSIRTFG